MYPSKLRINVHQKDTLYRKLDKLTLTAPSPTVISKYPHASLHDFRFQTGKDSQ